MLCSFIKQYKRQKNTLFVASIDEAEEEAEKQQVEGRVTEAKVLRRQRNRAARERCLIESGYKCYICDFDFEKVYGEIMCFVFLFPNGVEISS